MASQPLVRGTLTALAHAATVRALESGALRPVETERALVEDAGINFVVHRGAVVQSKTAAAQKRPAGANPFLPYEPALFVADVSDTHVCLLNKFPVVPGHVLLVTRQFQAQESLLVQADLEALVRGLDELDGLAFYNSSATAGASQAHRHLQLVPLPLGTSENQLPTEAALLADTLPFEVRHTSYVDSPTELYDRYLSLLSELGCHHNGASYNLLATRRWMAVVPRRHEAAEGISLNALGFAGSLFVGSAEQLATVKKHGPLALLSQAGVPRGERGS